MFCLSLILLLGCVFGSASAAENFFVGGTRYDDGARSLELIVNDYRSDGGQAPTSADVNINGADLADISVERFSNTDLPATFVFVVDNTSNAYTDVKSLPDLIAQNIMKQRQGKNDDFYLVSFDHERQNVFGPVKVPADAFSHLNYASPGVQGKVDVHAALKKAIEVLNSDDKFSKKVIILITDGNRLPHNNITDQELHDMLSSNGYPVYTCGVVQSEAQKYIDTDQAWLENVSHQSGGIYDRFKDSLDQSGNGFVAHMGRSLLLKGTLPETFGLEKAGTVDARLSMRRNNTVLGNVNAKIQLPAIQPAVVLMTPTAEEGTAPEEPEAPAEPETPAEAETPTPEPTAVPTDTPVPSATPEPTATNTMTTGEKVSAWLSSNLLIVIGAIVLLVAAIIAILKVIQNKKEEERRRLEEERRRREEEERRRRQEEQKRQDELKKIELERQMAQNKKQPQPRYDDYSTVEADSGRAPRGTQPTPPANQGKVLRVILDDLETRRQIRGEIKEGENKVFGRLDPKNRNNGVIVISDNDTHISRNQFMISFTGGRSIIRDLGTTNGTYVNGTKIEGEVVLQSGSRIRVGNVAGKREYSVSLSII